MTERKAEILTEAEVARYMTFPYLLEGGTGERALSTIRQMAGLLEEKCTCTDPWVCEPCQHKQALLARYKGERTP